MRGVWPLLLSVQLVAFNVLADDEEKEPKGQNLIILVIDGYGSALLNRTDQKYQVGIQKLVDDGVRADYLKPVFPPQSYPSIYSLSTGLYVESHNFTADFMYDPKKEIFFQRDEGANDSSPVWWTGSADPIWYVAGKKHIDVHCYWFGTCHRPYRDLMVSVPPNRRQNLKKENVTDVFAYVPRIVKHVKKYQYHKQQLVLIRYNGLAKALRLFADDSNAGKQALASTDAQIRKIQEEMEAHDLFDSTNLIVMSDHGLGKIGEDNQFYIEECLTDTSKVKRVVNNLAFTFVYPEPEDEDSVYFELRVCDQWAPMGDYEDEDSPLVAVYRRNELPEKYHWKDSRFIAPIVLITKKGSVTQIASTDVSEAQGRELRMIGGWDNEDPEMQGIFLARGPAFKHQEQVGPIEIVDVFQLAVNILGIESSHEHNGTWANVEALLSDGWEDRQTEPDAGNGLLPSALLLLFTAWLVIRH